MKPKLKMKIWLDERFNNVKLKIIKEDFSEKTYVSKYGSVTLMEDGSLEITGFKTFDELTKLGFVKSKTQIEKES